MSLQVNFILLTELYFTFNNIEVLAKVWFLSLGTLSLFNKDRSQYENETREAEIEWKQKECNG